MIEDRIARLRQELNLENATAFLVSNPENIYYLSGFDGEGWLLITSDKSIIATDSRYLEYAQAKTEREQVFLTQGAVESWFPSLVKGMSLTSIWVEAEHISLALFNRLKNAALSASAEIELRPTENLVGALRLVKDPGESESIEVASAIADAAIAYANTLITEGITEIELAWRLEQFMRDKGSEPLPFPVIVGSGPNAALPHARPTERRLRLGEPVVIDIGARVNGYASDLTRTFCVGTLSSLFRERYNMVLSAQTAALQGIRPGMSGAEADSLAREFISQAGYGESFIHSLGHGVGLNVHEGPSLGPNSTDILKTGMVFTIEPGVYFSGWGGIRIEDTVVLQENGVRSLTRTPK